MGRGTISLSRGDYQPDHRLPLGEQAFDSLLRLIRDRCAAEPRLDARQVARRDVGIRIANGPVDLQRGGVMIARGLPLLLSLG